MSNILVSNGTMTRKPVKQTHIADTPVSPDKRQTYGIYQKLETRTFLVNKKPTKRNKVRTVHTPTRDREIQYVHVFNARENILYHYACNVFPGKFNRS